MQGAYRLLTDPFAFGPDMKGRSLTKAQHVFGPTGAVKFDCVLARIDDSGIHGSPSTPAQMIVDAAPVNAYPQYCTEPGRPLLRYSSNQHGTLAVQYDATTSFEGRYEGRLFRLVNGGVVRLKLTVEALDVPSETDTAALTPPADAIGPLPQHVTLQESSRAKSTIHDQPDMPAAGKPMKFAAVFVNLTIGPNGHIMRVEPIGGPPALHQAAIDAATKWRFEPAKLNGVPVEAEMIDAVVFGGGGGGGGGRR
jgi:hypothetical protein